MRLYIDSLNGFRAGNFIATALRLGFMSTTDVEIVYNRADATHALLYATLANNDHAEANIELSKKVPTVLLHDDYNIPGDYESMSKLSAYDFDFIKAVYWHPLYQQPYNRPSKYDLVYGGTFKHTRLESYKKNIVDKPSTLLIGSDKEWDVYFPNTTRMKTIKDMDVLYYTMAQAKYTFIASDLVCDGNMLPLRALEAHMCGLNLHADEGVLPATYSGGISINEAVMVIKTIKGALNGCK